jgi:predicted hotdog family 3-hydroxylacyl-ACP dehydratase
MAAVQYPPIEQLLPHKAPMILIDRMIDATDTGSMCEVTIGPQTLFIGPRGVPAFVGLEYMAQAVAAYGGYKSYLAGEPMAIGFLLGTPQLKTSCQFFDCGQTLQIQVTHVWGENELMQFHCTIQDPLTGKILQQAELTIFKPQNLQSYLHEIGR